MGPGLSASGPSRDPAMACGLTRANTRGGQWRCPGSVATPALRRCPRTDLSFPTCTQWLTPPTQDDSHLALVEETWSAEGQGCGLRRQVAPPQPPVRRPHLETGSDAAQRTQASAPLHSHFHGGHLDASAGCSGIPPPPRGLVTQPAMTPPPGPPQPEPQHPRRRSPTANTKSENRHARVL